MEVVLDYCVRIRGQWAFSVNEHNLNERNIIQWMNAFLSTQIWTFRRLWLNSMRSRHKNMLSTNKHDIYGNFLGCSLRIGTEESCETINWENYMELSERVRDCGNGWLVQEST